MGQSQPSKIIQCPQKSPQLLGEIFSSIPELNPVCRENSIKYWRGEYTADVNINLLEPFFNAHIAVALFNKNNRNSRDEYQYETAFEELRNLIIYYNKIEFIIYGDDELLEEVKKILKPVNQQFSDIKAQVMKEINDIKNAKK